MSRGSSDARVPLERAAGTAARRARDRPVAPDSITLRSPATRLLRLGLSLRLWWLSIPALLGPIISATLVPLLPKSARLPLAAWWAIAIPLTLVLRVIVNALAVERRATLTVEASGVHVAQQGMRRRSFTRSEIEGVMVLSAEEYPAIELHLTRGRVLRVTVQTNEEAYAARQMLAFAPEARRTGVTLRGDDFLAASPFLLIASMVLAGVSFAVIDAYHAFGYALVWVLTALAAWALARPSEPHALVIGIDGLIVQRLRGALRIPLHEVEEVFYEASSIKLRRRDGEPVTLPIVDEPLAHAVVDHIEEARSLARDREQADTVAALEPAGRSLAEWRAALAALATHNMDYRHARIDEASLFATLEDASKPAGARLGAALALRAGEHDDARRRVRIAAATSADDDLRAALEATAEEEIDEAPIKRVIEPR